MSLSMDFSRIIAKAYFLAEIETSSLLSVEDTAEVLLYFFSSYEKQIGASHPFIKAEKLSDIIKKMRFCEVSLNQTVELFADDYKCIIDEYFSTSFSDSCNYQIFHFFSGMIRGILLLKII